MSSNPPSYEQARDELIDVVRRLESGGVPLADSMALWERGEQLAAICQEWLDGARAKVDAARRGEAPPPATAQPPAGTPPIEATSPASGRVDDAPRERDSAGPDQVEDRADDEPEHEAPDDEEAGDEEAGDEEPGDDLDGHDAATPAEPSQAPEEPEPPKSKPAPRNQKRKKAAS